MAPAPATTIDWSALSLEAVNALIAQAEERRIHLRREAQALLRAEFEQRAAQLGMTLQDVIGLDPAPVAGKAPRRRRTPQGQAAPKPPQPVRFRGPDGQTWSGRGPTPRWLKALEAAGKTRDQFTV